MAVYVYRSVLVWTDVRIREMKELAYHIFHFLEFMGR